MKITEPKTSVYLTPSLAAPSPREIQIIDFVRIRKPFFNKQNMPQHVYKINDDGTQTELLRFNVADHCPIEEIQTVFKSANKDFSIIEVAEDWYMKSSSKIKLTKGLYTELGVTEILEKGKPYALLWTNSDAQRFFVYCDLVGKDESYFNIIVAIVTSRHHLNYWV